MDDLVRYSDHGIGTVVNAGFSPIRGDWVALALLDLAYAHPGVTPLRLGERDAPGKTVRPPVIANRSLYVNPQVHSYASRAADGFPPIHSA